MMYTASVVLCIMYFGVERQCYRYRDDLGPYVTQEECKERNIEIISMFIESFNKAYGFKPTFYGHGYCTQDEGGKSTWVM